MLDSNVFPEKRVASCKWERSGPLWFALYTKNPVSRKERNLWRLPTSARHPHIVPTADRCYGTSGGAPTIFVYVAPNLMTSSMSVPKPDAEKTNSTAP